MNFNTPSKSFSYDVAAAGKWYVSSDSATVADGVGGCVFDNPGNGTSNWVGVFLIEGQLACRMSHLGLAYFGSLSTLVGCHRSPPLSART